MPSTEYLVATVATAAAITVALRAAPFVLMSRLRSSTLIGYLGRHLPAGLMVILVAYLLSDSSLDHLPLVVPELAAVAVTLAVHLWLRIMLLSVVLGVATFAIVSWSLPT